MMGVMYISLRLSLVIALCFATPALAQSVATTTQSVDPETYVRKVFNDAPAMIAVAQCESRFRQFTDSGRPLYGGYGDSMVGVFQIYASVHAGDAQILGHDLETLEGNVGYARYLYDQSGTQPWDSSAYCWEPLVGTISTTSAPTPLSVSEQASTTPTSDTVPTSVTQVAPIKTTAITMTLFTGVLDSQVLSLQQLLNNSGFTIATQGPGSPGQETYRYGALTRSAVQKFQCAKKIVCSGDDDMTGYGVVGPRTRAALMTLSLPLAVETAPTQNQ